jgi:hypothetical protein
LEVFSMAAKDPAAVATDWVNKLSGAGDKITRGVQGVTVAPGQAAARQQAAYVANVNARAAVWAQRVAAVPLATWQGQMVTKGIPRIGTGAAAAHDKFAGFLMKLLPYVNAGRGTLPARGSFDQNKQRAMAWIDYMHKFHQ